ncbi:GTPase HflX [Clostridium sp. CX1]|uniref:GTPase HflX n=1 Tax=Clostridium tanneri TaxID=3037988 RepID=A0ABU4JP77_9CLOT|nr:MULTISPECIES: GTPase HflX [unclassified Clostridium]MCT8977191.1 GTPase HflX [Clostridium sp. CX1]MDW8799935.1 GTPase HflX [Clostridium sp. A1-XYC3]
MIYGNTEGVKNFILDKLEQIYEMKIPKDSICNEELIDIIAEATSYLNREVSVAVTRKGAVVAVAIGDSSTVEMPEIDVKEKKLCGVRIIHTHPNGNSRLSAIDISALIKLKLDCIAAVAVEDNKVIDMSIGFCGIEDDLLVGESTEPITIEQALHYNILDRINHIESLMKNNDIIDDDSERAVLVGVESEESLEELAELARACNVKVVHAVLQKRSTLDTAFYVGRGKVEEIALLRQSCNANVVIFDDELSASQVRNLEENLGAKVIDRTTLILEIFATRARSRESKIQVELAQLKYRLPRLSGLGTVLSRTGGGIGTRGPGEKKLEVDKRHIREKIYDLTRELKKIRQVRETQRGRRTNIPKVSLVGYTNAGKSTLRNKLCEIAMPKENSEKEKVFEADMLFATLDITTRAIALPDSRVITITDTVGFIKKLPHDLVEAFKSTLEEVLYSDLLLHVVDVSSDTAEEQIDAVNNVLSQLGAKDKPTILVLNKIDRASEERIKEIEEEYAGIQIIKISAREGINLDSLLEVIGNALPYTLKEVEYIIPYSDQSMVAFLHRNGKVKEEEYRDEGTYIRAMVEDEVFNKCESYMIK